MNQMITIPAAQYEAEIKELIALREQVAREAQMKAGTEFWKNYTKEDAHAEEMAWRQQFASDIRDGL